TFDNIKSKIKAIKQEEWNYENLRSYLRISRDIGTKLTRHEQAKAIADIFTEAVLFRNELVLITDVYNGIHIKIRIPVEKDVWIVNRWVKEDIEKGRIIYTE